MPKLTSIGVGVGSCQNDKPEHFSLAFMKKHACRLRLTGGTLSGLSVGPCQGDFCQLQSFQCQSKKGPDDSSQLAIYCTECKMRTREGK